MENDPEARAGLVTVISLCRLAEAVAIGMLIPILPVFLEELTAPVFEGYTPEELTAILFSSGAFATALIQLLAMRLSDVLDRRKIFVLVGLAGAVVCSVSYLFLTTYSELLVARTLQGICLGLTFPPLMAIVARYSPPGSGGRVLATYSTIRLLGFASGPLLGGMISKRWGLDATFSISAVLLGVSIAAVGLWVPDYRDFAPQRDGSVASPPRPKIERTFLVLGSCVFLMMIGISAIISLFPYYRREFHASEDELGLIFSAFLGTRCILQYPLGWLGDRLGKKMILLTALCLYIPAVGLQGYVTAISQLVWLRVALGVVSAAITVSVNGIAAERSEPGNRATVMGINTFCFSLGVGVGPLLGGFCTEENPAYAFLWPAGATLLVLVLVATLVASDRQWRETRATVISRS